MVWPAQRLNYHLPHSRQVQVPNLSQLRHLWGLRKNIKNMYVNFQQPYLNIFYLVLNANKYVIPSQATCMWCMTINRILIWNTIIMYPKPHTYGIQYTVESLIFMGYQLFFLFHKYREIMNLNVQQSINSLKTCIQTLENHEIRYSRKIPFFPNPRKIGTHENKWINSTSSKSKYWYRFHTECNNTI